MLGGTTSAFLSFSPTGAGAVAASRLDKPSPRLLRSRVALRLSQARAHGSRSCSCCMNNALASLDWPYCTSWRHARGINGWTRLEVCSAPHVPDSAAATTPKGVPDCRWSRACAAGVPGASGCFGVARRRGDPVPVLGRARRPGGVVDPAGVGVRARRGGHGDDARDLRLLQRGAQELREVEVAEVVDLHHLLEAVASQPEPGPVLVGVNRL